MMSQRQGQGFLHDGESQLVTEAIAAFHHNNGNRRLTDLPKLTRKLMTGIVMINSTAFFYLIPVTETLVDEISTGSYPADETVVFQFLPPIPDNVHYADHGKGMRPLENRRIILEAFKKFVTVSFIYLSNMSPYLISMGVLVINQATTMTKNQVFERSYLVPGDVIWRNDEMYSLIRLWCGVWSIEL